MTTPKINCDAQHGECPWKDWEIDGPCQVCTRNQDSEDKKHDYSKVIRNHGY